MPDRNFLSFLSFFVGEPKIFIFFEFQRYLIYSYGDEDFTYIYCKTISVHDLTNAINTFSESFFGKWFKRYSNTCS